MNSLISGWNYLIGRQTPFCRTVQTDHNERGNEFEDGTQEFELRDVLVQNKNTASRIENSQEQELNAHVQSLELELKKVKNELEEKNKECDAMRTELQRFSKIMRSNMSQDGHYLHNKERDLEYRKAKFSTHEYSYRARNQDKSLEEPNHQKRDVIKVEDHNSANYIRRQFLQHFCEAENLLPEKLNVRKLKLWPLWNEIFKISFEHCRKRFIDILTEPLYLLTELNETEYNTSQTDWDRKDELDNVFTAYECLLTYSLQSSSKLGCIDKSIVDNVISSVTDDTNKEVVSQLHDQVRKAVELCWRMQMLPTPMFICQPRVYNDEWHETHRKTWSDNPNDLVYYRPVLMNSAGGTVAYKGFVGNSGLSSVTSKVDASDIFESYEHINLLDDSQHSCKSQSQEIGNLA